MKDEDKKGTRKGYLSCENSLVSNLALSINTDQWQLTYPPVDGIPDIVSVLVDDEHSVALTLSQVVMPRHCAHEVTERLKFVEHMAPFLFLGNFFQFIFKFPKCVVVTAP